MLSAVFRFDVSVALFFIHDVVVCCCVSCNLRLQPTIVDLDVRVRGTVNCALLFSLLFRFHAGAVNRPYVSFFLSGECCCAGGVLRSVSMRGGGGWSRRLESLVCASLPLDCSFVCDDV